MEFGFSFHCPKKQLHICTLCVCSPDTESGGCDGCLVPECCTGTVAKVGALSAWMPKWAVADPFFARTTIMIAIIIIARVG